MNSPKTDDETQATLFFHASGFVVKSQGRWSEADLAQFRHFLTLRRLSPTDAELFAALDEAKKNFLHTANRLFICCAQPCRDKLAYDISPDSLAHWQNETGVAISQTGCQGPCKQAPVVSLRVRETVATFAEVASAEDWHEVLRFVKAAAHAGTLLVDSGAAEKFRFDPVHDHGKPSAHMKPLEFLLGHFRGEGQYAMRPYSFQKEVVGSFEAGGRFIGLRMGASYPLADGREDVHRAFVMVGAAPSGAITAHAYTDGGIMREYAVAQHDGAIDFSDIPPGHTSQWPRARKILRPTEFGFEERLEVDDGSGTFKPYYVIAMQKVD